jgi:hypothetical protein
MVRHHPAVGQIHRFIELHCHDLGIHLHNDAFEPAAYAISLIILMVTIHFHPLADAINVLTVGSRGKS